MKILAACVLLLWPLTELGVCTPCTDKLRNETCSCNSGEVCCNNCCGGQNCVPRISDLQEECLDCRRVRKACTDELRNETCSCNSGEVCCNNCCGGQTCVPRISGSTCPDGSNPVDCFVSPCLFESCFVYPNAICIDNYCGGCNADWYVDGKLVDCNVCKLPLVRGPCNRSIRRWGYRDGRCRRFTYGGCEGNRNRFSRKRKCLAACTGWQW